MDLLIDQLNGARRWHIIINDDELYEILCTQMAWRVRVSSQKDDEYVERAVVLGIQHMIKHPQPDKIPQIKDPLIRAIISECARLNIDLPEEDDEKPS